MTEEEKGFVIKDRRAFDETGHAKEDTGDKKPEQAKTEKAARKKAQDAPRSTPLPEVSFSSLMFSLSSSALFHLGEITDPNTGENKVDLPLAKHAIDTIAMLREKTRGNLTSDEEKFTDGVLTDLRLRYVKRSS